MNTGRNSIKQKMLAFLMSLAMVFSMIPMMADEARADVDSNVVLVINYGGQDYKISEDNWDSFDSIAVNTIYSSKNRKGNYSSVSITLDMKAKALDDVIKTVIGQDSIDNNLEVYIDETKICTYGELFTVRKAYQEDGTEIGNVVPALYKENSEMNLVVGQLNADDPNMPYCRNGIAKITLAEAASEGGSESGGDDIAFDNSWYKETENNFTLNDEADIRGLAKLVNEGNNFEGKIIKLGNAITLTGKWTPIGIAEKPFKGTFDGSGFVINGMDINAGNYTGLFGFNMGTIKNLTINGSISGNAAGDYIGGVAGFNGGIIESVVSNVNIDADKAYSVGGIAGINTSGKWYDGTNQNSLDGARGIIKNCLNNGNVKANKKIGGIAGNNAGTLDSCVNKGEIANTSGSKAGCGGIAGMNGNNDAAYSTGKIFNCYNVGKVNAFNAAWSGGIAGFNSGDYKNAEAIPSEIKNCYSIGTISNPFIKNDKISDCGDICGKNDLKSGENIDNCYAANDFEDLGKAEVIKRLGQAYTADTANINNGYPILKWQGPAEDNTGVNDNAKKDVVVETGDNSNIIPIMILMLLAIAGTVICGRKIRA